MNVLNNALLSHMILASVRNSSSMVRHQSQTTPAHSSVNPQVPASRHTFSLRGRRREISKSSPIYTLPTYAKSSKEHCHKAALAQPSKSCSQRSDPKSRSKYWVTFMQRRWHLVTVSPTSRTRKSSKTTRTWSHHKKSTISHVSS